LAVPARRVGRGADVAGAELVQHGLEVIAARVTERVVAHDRLDGAAALLDKPSGGATQTGGDVGGVLGAVQLAVRQARVVVLDADDDRLADPPGPRGLAAIAGGPVARRVELRGRKRVDVQQGAGLGPLITSRSRA